MKSFAEFAVLIDKIREADQVDNNLTMNTGTKEDERCLNNAVEVAVRKGHKTKLVQCLKDIGDEEIIKALDDQKGLGDVTSSNNASPQGPPENEITPSPSDTFSPGIDRYS